MKKLLLSGVAGLLIVTGCSAGPSSQTKGDNTGGDARTSAKSTSTESAPAEDGTTVTFKVTTSTKATVMWGTTSGTSQDEIKKGSWSKKVKLADFDAATLVVTNADFMKSSSVSCDILLNGVSKSKNSAKGKVASASCSTSTLS